MIEIFDHFCLIYANIYMIIGIPICLSLRYVFPYNFGPFNVSTQNFHVFSKKSSKYEEKYSILAIFHLTNVNFFNQLILDS